MSFSCQKPFQNLVIDTLSTRPPSGTTCRQGEFRAKFGGSKKDITFAAVLKTSLIKKG
jgi:hypothetical protein